MDKRPFSYGTLFTSALKLSAFTFGGGYVIVGLMRRKFVDELRWLEEDEMLDLTAMAQSAPGPIAVNAAILLGERLAGLTGAAVAALGTVLPPLVILSLVSLAYTALRDNRVVAAVLKGMQAGIAAVVFSTALDLFRGIWAQRRILPLVVLTGALLAGLLFDSLSVAWIILACGLVGVAAAAWGRRKGDVP